MAAEPGSLERVWREKARSLASEVVRPRAEMIDREDRLPDGLLRALAEGGFLSVGLPERWGGREGDTRSIAAVIEELSKASASVGTLVSVHLSVCAQPIARWGTDAQKEEYLRPLAEGKALGAFALTEPGAGSDAARIACRYGRDGASFILRGGKMFITNAAIADVLLAFATVDPSKGSSGISAFIVPMSTPGVSVPRNLEKLGLHGSPTNEVVFDGARLPGHALLGAEGRGLAIALESLAGGRVGIAACALGVADAAFQELREAVRSNDEPWAGSLLARGYTLLTAARALVERAAGRKDAGEPFVEEASAAKLFASDVAVWIAGRAIDVGGQAAVRSGSRAERLLRDARVFPIVEGTTEIQELILARSLAGR